MDIPPTYQEATAKKPTWLRRIVGRLFRRTPPQPGLLVEQKLITPYRSDFEAPRTSKSSKRDSALTQQLTTPTIYRNSVIHTNDQPPTNYVRIKRNNAPIIGVWNIDTSLQVPANILVPFKDRTEARHHLHLWSVTQTINAFVNVIGEGKDTVLITCSTLGKVNLQLRKPSNRSLSVFCRGTVISVKIPRNYSGSVKCHTSKGTVHFSNEVGKRISTVYEKNHESRHFIGELPSSSSSTSAEGGDTNGNGENDGCAYDVMKLKAKSREGEKYGEVYIAFEDETELPLMSTCLKF